MQENFNVFLKIPKPSSTRTADLEIKFPVRVEIYQASESCPYHQQNEVGISHHLHETLNSTSDHVNFGTFSKLILSKKYRETTQAPGHSALESETTLSVQFPSTRTPPLWPVAPFHMLTHCPALYRWRPVQSTSPVSETLTQLSGHWTGDVWHGQAVNFEAGHSLQVEICPARSPSQPAKPQASTARAEQSAWRRQGEREGETRSGTDA